MKRVVVIGGGISGLAAAHRLVERSAETPCGLEVRLVESGPRLGGIIRTDERDGFLLERGPDSFISEKREVVELAGRIGLSARLVETNAQHRRSFIVRGGRLHPVPEGFQLLAPSRFLPFLTTGIFSWAGKARMALDLFLPRGSGANGSHDESLAQFVRRRLGREALERMAQPMVGGIYTADPEKLSLRATMPRFLEMEREHRSVILAMWKQRRTIDRAMSRGTSGARYSLFLSFDRGMQVLVDGLAARLPAGATRLGIRVRSVSFDHPARDWKMTLADGEIIAADAVCLAMPSYAAAELIQEQQGELAAELRAVPYASTATVNLAFRREDIAHPLDGFGFVAPFVERRAVLACTFSSVKFAGRAPAGRVLVRAFVGGALQPEMLTLADDEMVTAVLGDLRELLGIAGSPLLTSVQRWPHSMAQYQPGHLERIAKIRLLINASPTLKLAGNAYGGAGIPDCIRSGETAADEILAEIARSSAASRASRA